MHTNSKTNLAVAISCSLLLCLPVLGMIFPTLDTTPRLAENRNLADNPSLSWASLSSYPKQFENYFNDHFGYRNLLIRLQIDFNDKVLNIEDKGLKAFKGMDGWIFYAGNRTVESYRGFNPLSSDQLEQWRNMLEKKKAFLKSQGIEYLFVVAPNKSSIYPEYLPSWIQKSGKVTPLDQLVAYLKDNSKVEILDLRNVLKAEKRKGPLLYFQTDTHWNQLGAFVAYREIMRSVGQQIHTATALSLDKVKIEYREVKGGDLALLLGTQDDVTEEVPVLTPLIKQSKVIFRTGGPSHELLMESPSVDPPRAIMFGDSFANALSPYLSEDFSSIKYMLASWTEQTSIKKILTENKPDIVIEERVERHIHKMSKVSFGRD